MPSQHDDALAAGRQGKYLQVLISGLPISGIHHGEEHAASNMHIT